MVKDLSAFATPALEIRLRPGREVTIQPPNVKDGALLAMITTLGSAIATGEVGDSVDETLQSTIEGMTEEDVKRLAVGDEYDRMVSENWPWPDINTVCQYAAFHWVYGEHVADQIMSAQASLRPGKKVGSGKSRGRGKSGRRTA